MIFSNNIEVYLFFFYICIVFVQYGGNRDINRGKGWKYNCI